MINIIKKLNDEKIYKIEFWNEEEQQWNQLKTFSTYYETYKFYKIVINNSKKGIFRIIEIIIMDEII